MDEIERYEYDLKGYFTLPRVLSTDEVNALNATIDETPWRADAGQRYLHVGLDEPTMASGNRDPSMGPVDLYGGVVLSWGEAYRRLVAQPDVAPYLRAILGEDYRFDHGYLVLMGSEQEGPGGNLGPRHALHNGGVPFDPTQHHLVRDGRIFSGLVAVSFALTDVRPGDGGFCLIPGSHKSGYPLPGGGEGKRVLDWVVQPELRAGDCVIFSEALTHGALPWVAETERRTLLYKYCPGYMQWERGSPFVDVDAYDWTPAERAVLHPPRAV